MIGLPYGNVVYKIAPDMRLVCAIEDEMGAVPLLADRFSGNGWKICDLVTFIHILLQAAGKNADFLTLGDAILKSGTEKYLTIAQKILREMMQP